MMEAYLVVSAGHGVGFRIPLPAGSTVTLGRKRSNTVPIKDDGVSREHAEIVCTDDNWVLRDLDSLNGTYVNGIAVSQTTLRPGDEIRIGGKRFRFCIETGKADADRTSVFRFENEESTSTLVGQAQFDRSDLEMLCSLMADLRDEDAHATIRRTLELLLIRMRASVVGYLSVEEIGDRLPGLVLPTDTKVDQHLSRTLTRMVLQDKRPLWMAQARRDVEGESLSQLGDAMCFPVATNSEALLGTLHVYRRDRRFATEDYQLGQIIARHLADRLSLHRLQLRLKAENRRLRRNEPRRSDMVGDSAVMQRLREQVRRVAGQREPVLIRGETGAGKELVALMVHRHSRRRDGPFLAVNCSAVAPGVFESVVFGHRRGSYTGADTDHLGLIRSANSGTLFLDEIGDVPLAFQPKLLRVLDGYGFIPVGEDQEVVVDVRYIAATNCDLESLVQQGRFRYDLLNRLQFHEISVPPLREHAEDIPQIAEAFLRERAEPSEPPPRLTPAALRRLQEYDWPGNVRELQRVLAAAATHATGGVIDADAITFKAVPRSLSGDVFNLNQVERETIERALASTSSIAEAARLLGISRARIYRLLRKHNISPDR